MSEIKLSSIIARQIPEFVREEHPKFVSFLKTYYEFLEQTNVILDIKSVKDIDRTLDEFVSSFIKEFAKNLPASVLSERILIQRIRDIYEAKGTDASFELLFKILFNSKASVERPSERILRCSDGRWNQDRSIFISVIEGSAEELSGKTVRLNTNNTSLQFTIEKIIQSTQVDDEGVILPITGQYEILLEKNLNIKDIQIGSILTQSDISFTGRVLGTINSVTVISPGSGFRLGQLLKIYSNQGGHSLIKVTEVSSGGGIISASVVKFSSGYNIDFIFNTSSNLAIDGDSLPYSIIGSSINLADSTTGFTDFGQLNRFNYVNDMWDNSYCGELLSEFRDVTKSNVTDPASVASFSISIGPVAKYPGYYSSNKGFLSDAMVLQDGRYFQTFSYVIRAEEKLNEYKSILKSVLHPSGMALFGERELTNTLDLSVNLEAMIKSGISNKRDFISVSEFKFIDFIKSITDVAVIVDQLNISVSKLLQDTYTVADIAALALTKYSLDSISLTDFVNLTTSKVNLDVTVVTDFNSLTLNKIIDDSIFVSDSVGFNNSLDTIESVSSSDAGKYQLNGYFEFGYADDYVGDYVSF